MGIWIVVTVQNLDEQIKKIKGPVLIFGAGGFVGFNLLQKLLSVRKDVFGVFSDPSKNWRLKKKTTSPRYVVKCDIGDRGALSGLISRIKPQAVFNLAAYGAYSTQKDIDNIYQTNFNSTYVLIEEVKKYGFSAYVHAGSQSEYGFNCTAPSEDEELIPDSHYAVSKTADYYLLKHYGKIEKLPVVHLRLYSVYGLWEEPNRLIPTLIREARKGKLPKFVDPDISRDFVNVEDASEAFIRTAVILASDPAKGGVTPESNNDSESRYALRATRSRQAGMTKKILKRAIVLSDSEWIHYDKLYGEAFNVCTGKKTTIRKLAYLAKKLFNIKEEPKFGSMKNREWDLKDWYGNPKKINNQLDWKAKTSLESGLEKLFLL